ncbi:small VCP interacting protein [Lycorma delicatula]|uniref:small VCP interacting protein n=1 Tax=Lycorma delicatula TaxID=130591 RepID=UPI003F50EC7C
MGICYSCCKDSATDYVTPDMETRRQQQAQAAERRFREQESRGVKDPERIKRMQQKSEEIEKRQEEALKYGSDTGLKWQVN